MTEKRTEEPSAESHLGGAGVHDGRAHRGALADATVTPEQHAAIRKMFRDVAAEQKERDEETRARLVTEFAEDDARDEREQADRRAAMKEGV